MLDHFKAYSLLPKNNPENGFGVKNLRNTDLAIVNEKQDLNVKVLTWKDSDFGFLKQFSSEWFSNFFQDFFGNFSSLV